MVYLSPSYIYPLSLNILGKCYFLSSRGLHYSQEASPVQKAEFSLVKHLSPCSHGSPVTFLIVWWRKPQVKTVWLVGDPDISVSLCLYHLSILLYHLSLSHLYLYLDSCPCLFIQKCLSKTSLFPDTIQGPRDTTVIFLLSWSLPFQWGKADNK
jgi:hypothetical protein